MPQDLLSFLEKIKVELSDEFVTIEDEIDPVHAIAADRCQIGTSRKKTPCVTF